MKGSFDDHNSHHHDHYNTLKRKWHGNNINNHNHHHLNIILGSFAAPTAMSMAPQITVVLEGRSICQRISLHNHESYQSLAKALGEMFVVDNGEGGGGGSGGGDDLEANSVSDDDHELALSNAVPGHLVAYEDMEDDLLLVGDLKWKDFVRVAKRIRIIPLKANLSRKGRTETT